MSYRVHIDGSVNCVFVQHFGTISSGEITEQLKILVQDPAFNKNMSLLRDVTQTSLPENYDLEWFRQTSATTMALVDDDLGTGRKVAWVLSSVNDYKVVHQWSVVGRLNTKVMERRPFRDITKAMNWLGIPEGYVIPYQEWS